MQNFRNKGNVASQQSRTSFVPMASSSSRPMDIGYTANRGFFGQSRSRSRTPNRGKRVRSVSRSRSVPRVRFSPMQMKTQGSSGGGFRGRKRFKGKKKSKKQMKPLWFKTLLKQDTPSIMSAQYTGQILTGINTKVFSCHWKHLSLIDIDNANREAANAATSATTVSALSNKAYIFDLVRRHVWRNSEANAACHVTAYVLYPRRDFPSYSGVVAGAPVGMPTISPPTSNVVTSGGFVLDPILWQQPFTDENPGAQAAVRISYYDPATTPFMNPALTTMFKIKLLKIKFPFGYASQGILEPGQTLQYVGKRSRPYMCTYNKYGMVGNKPYTLALTYEILKETPLIVLQIKGTPSHDTTNKTLIGLGPANLDYIQDFSWKYLLPQNSIMKISNPTSGAPAVAIAEQVEVVTASVGTEALL